MNHSLTHRRPGRTITRGGWGTFVLHYRPAPSGPAGDEAPLPTPVQDAVDFGRALPSVRVYYRDLRGVPTMDTIDVDFLVDLPGGECIEVGTHWVGDGLWRMCSALWRTFSSPDEMHPLGTWGQVREFLAERADAAA